MSGSHGADTRRILRDLQVLTRDIGVRLAGTSGERAAIDFIADQFRDTGANVSVEPFPMLTCGFQQSQLSVGINGKWTDFECAPLCHSSSTGGHVVEAPLVVFEAPADSNRTDLGFLNGAAVLHLGSHFQSRQQYQRLIDVAPAMVLLVDVRYPGTMPLADSLFPTLCKSVGAVPTVNVAYHDAWRWISEHADAVRLTINGEMREGQSANVIAEIPGNEADSEVIICGAHHDTQAGSIGADDNASGVVTLLELARLLAQNTRRRSIRLISFGTEEQLSVGSVVYTTSHADSLREFARCMINLDSIGSCMGWTRINYNGPSAMRDYFELMFASNKLYAEYSEEVTPYADHFPFARLGVPTAMVRRLNCTSGRFFHHRPDDDLSKVDPRLISLWTDGVARVLGDLGSAVRMPFPAEIPYRETAVINSLWNELFNAIERPATA